MIGGRTARRAKWHVVHGQALEWISIGFLALLIIAPVSILIWLLFSTDIFTVQAITVVDARPHTEETIREQTSQLIGKNILLLETKSVEGSIITNTSQIRDVHIVRKLPSGLKIVVQEKRPALLLLSSGSYYFIDEAGIAYEKAQLDRLPGIALPVIKNTGESGDVRLGVGAVNKAFVEFIVQANSDIPDVLSTDIAEFRIPSLATREVHMLLTNNWLVRFDTTRPLDVQIDILQRLLAHTIPVEKLPLIEYIDLRIPNRVYYKFIGATPEPTPSADI